MTAPAIPPAGQPPRQPRTAPGRPRPRDTAPAARLDLPLDRRRGRAVPGHRLRPGHRPKESTTRHGHRRPQADQPHPVRVTAGRGRHPAAAAGPARHGPRLGPHRPRRRRPSPDHPQARPRRRPHRQPPAAHRHHRRLRRLVGQTRPRNAPLPSAARPPPPANVPSPGTGAPPPPWTTTCSTPPATGPGRAGNPPPAPAPPPTSARRPASTGRAAHDQRRPLHLGIDPRRARGPGTPRLPPVRQPAHRPRPSARSSTSPTSTTAPATSPTATTRRRHRTPGQDHLAPRQTTRSSSPTPKSAPSSRALDIAADYKRDRAAACADCADQTCVTCQSRLRDAGGLRPDGHPDAAHRQGRPDRQLRSARAGQPATAPPAPPRSGPGGRPVTSPHRKPEPRTPQPSAAFVPHPQPSEEDLLELRDPYDLEELSPNVPMAGRQAAPST